MSHKKLSLKLTDDFEGNTNKDDADCTTQVTCSVCGDVLVEAKAHVWGDWTTTLEPTTTTEGSKERLCTNDGCEAKDTKSIPMLNEVEVPEPEGGEATPFFAGVGQLLSIHLSKKWRKFEKISQKLLIFSKTML